MHIKLFSELNRIIAKAVAINMRLKNLSDQFSRYSRQHVHFQRILSSTARAGAWSAPLNNTRPNQQHQKSRSDRPQNTWPGVLTTSSTPKLAKLRRH